MPLKLYISMPPEMKPFYHVELSEAKRLLQQGKLQECWRHYERAHILGQPYSFAHSYVHWQMLKFGIKIKSSKEIFGQITRLVFGGVKSFVGKIPVGNTGGANIPPLKPMEIPEDLAIIINNTKTK